MKPSHSNASQRQGGVATQEQALQSRRQSQQSQQVVSKGDSVAELLVQVGGRLLSVSAESQASYVHLMKDLASRLQVGGQAALRLADAAGSVISCNQELEAALAEGRVPLQASLTAVALRDVEQRKLDVEARKEELMHLQWQVVVDRMSEFSVEVSGIAAGLQATQDECHRSINLCQSEEAQQREQIRALIDRESATRDASVREVDQRLDKLSQALITERSARDVTAHQLQMQIERVTQMLDGEQAARAHDRSEMGRALQAMQHAVEMEQQRNSENWNQHLEMVRRLEAQLDQRSSQGGMADIGMTHLKSDSEKLRASISQMEVTVAVLKRTCEESLHRRADELSKAVRDEVVGRENHFARFAKDLETSFQSLEAKMARSREDASSSLAAVVEQTRVLERRCAAVEIDFAKHREATSEKEIAVAEKAQRAWTLADNLDASVRASDVVLKTTVTKVEALHERMVAAEKDLQMRPRHDFFKPQIESLQMYCQKQDARLTQVEKEMNAKFASEALQRDSIKADVHTSMRNCLDKISGSQSASAESKYASGMAPANAIGDQGFVNDTSGDSPMRFHSAPSRGDRRMVAGRAHQASAVQLTVPVAPQVRSCSTSGVSTPMMPVPHAMVQLLPVSGPVPMTSRPSSRPPSPLMTGPGASKQPASAGAASTKHSGSTSGFFSPRHPIVVQMQPGRQSRSAGQLSPRMAEPVSSS
mmetsp:Transcript_53861/g.155530  ORF Transcript_53861/g.155530 Transcript_53861/m.155530 type:complete len:707 (-) Transcript_53861:196-2316(-)